MGRRPVVTERQIRDALEAVEDPHIPVSLRRMGMLRGVEIGDDGGVRVRLCIPCLACPGVGMLRDDIEEALLVLDGVTSVVVDEGWHNRWTPDMVDDEARDLMRRYGIQT